MNTSLWLRRGHAVLLIAFVCIWIVVACAPNSSPDARHTPILSPLPTFVVATPFGSQTKFTDCVRSGILQDTACTPGSIFSNATAEIICVSGYTTRVRDSSSATKSKVEKEYNQVYNPKNPRAYEIDHLIPLELGGSNDTANLWVEPGAGAQSYHAKDVLENKMHALMCAGLLPLSRAQRQISLDWITAYHTYVGPL